MHNRRTPIKRIISAVLLLLLTALPLIRPSAVTAAESDTPGHIPRIVSIVFDDSGSMCDETDRWAYTSYAMQTFVAMMSSEDVLHVTFLNNPKKHLEVTLSESGKKSAIADFAETVFGGGTPNKLQSGANLLEEEYKTYGANAKYYLIVMADGELDKKQSFAEELPAVVRGIELPGAEFEAIYFAMGNLDSNINGVTNMPASTSDAIVEQLKNVSAKIMGRTDISDLCTLSGGKFSFDLRYPALSITLFVQKENGKFENISLALKKDGKNTSFDNAVYYVECPTSIRKNPNYSHVTYLEKNPSDPPAGFVSIWENSGSAPIPKGSYSVDVSSLGISESDVIVLVEPAVTVGCTYYIGDDPTPYDFDGFMDTVRINDTFFVKCGLYEMTADGSLGEPIGTDILAPEYELFIDGNKIDARFDDGKNAYKAQALEEYSNKELKIEANLDGYQPFVFKETFGTFAKRPVIGPGNDQFDGEIAFTKLDWPALADGTYEIRFPFEQLDSSMLRDLAIGVEGFPSLPSGTCLSLGDAVSVESGCLVYRPKLSGAVSFADLPERFTVSVTDVHQGTEALRVAVRVIRPQYRFETVNELSGVAFDTDSLKKNSKKIRFSLVADYEGDGSYVSVSDISCEENIGLVLHSDTLPGECTQENGTVTFIPRYDSETDTDFAPGDIFGKTHSIYATATVDGVSVTSESVSLTANSTAYKIEVTNGISQALSPDALRQNTQKITFRILADYTGSGNFGPLKERDSGVYELLTIVSDTLPGTVAIEYNDAGQAVGKSFTPRLDADSDISLSGLLGREHSIYAEATIDGGAVRSQSVSVSVSDATYKIEVANGITQTLDLDSLRINEEKIIFRLLADYMGNGTYTDLAEWDQAAYGLLTITSAKLPGTVAIEYDESGLAIGKSFVPLYDENNPDGLAFTEVAGKTHTVTGTVESLRLSCSTTVEVQAPVYEIRVKHDGITLVDAELRKNTQGIEFVVLRDGRQLTQKELEGLAPYDIFVKGDVKKLRVNTTVCADADTAFLLCAPVYGGLLPMFFVPHGDVEMHFNLGGRTAVAGLEITYSVVAWTIFWAIIALLAIILYLFICAFTKVRFWRGAFFRARFTVDGNAMTFASVSKQSTDGRGFTCNPIKLFRRIAWKPFSKQKFSTRLDGKSVTLTPYPPLQRFSCARAIPYCMGSDIPNGVLIATATAPVLDKIFAKDREHRFELFDTRAPQATTPFRLNGSTILMSRSGNNVTALIFLKRDDYRQIKARLRRDSRTPKTQRRTERPAPRKRNATRR